MKTTFGLLFTFILVSACQPKAEKSSSCGVGQSYNQVSRSCASSSALTASAVQQVPVNQLSAVSAFEDTSKIIYLTYSDANLDQALSCSVTAGANISAGACTCISGSCRFTLTPNSNFYGLTHFTYSVTDNDGASLSTSVNTTITSVDDAPAGTLSGSIAIFEDTLSTVSVTYVDTEGDAASACSIIATTNLGVATCACVAGMCTAQIQPTANINGMGMASFTYQVYANSSFSLPVSVSVNLTALDDFPVATTANATTLEDTAVNVALLYTDVENDVATTCNITTVTNVSVSTACTCVAGVCSVGITPNLNLNSSNSTLAFSYTVTANALTSPQKAVSLSVSAVDDAPVGNNVATSTLEDTAVLIALPFTDAEGSSASNCAISSLGGGTVSSCTCSTAPATQCEVTFTPTANLATSGSFQYTVNAGTGTSALKTVTIAITPMNDNPVLPHLSNLSNNEGAPFVTSFNVDEGGASDEDIQSLTLSINSDNPTLLPNGNITISFTEAADASDDMVNLTMIPVSGQNGVANITVLLTDNGAPVGSTSKTFSITVNPVSVIHNGWKNLKALGDKVNSNGSVLEAKSVTLEWEDFTIYGAAIGGYNVYRFTTSYSNDISQATLLNTTPIAFGTNIYTDNSSALAFGTTYYYVVRPLDSVYHLPTATIEPATYAEIKIPDQNMALLHRWAVNKEICQKLGQSADELNHYRCPYNGPGATISGYYDLGAHQFIDRFEAGCNYSEAPKCTTSGCVGIGNPNVNGCAGSACLISTSTVDLFYDRSSGTCFFTTNGSVWNAINSAFTSSALLAGAVNPTKAALPPLSQVNKDQANQYCTQQGKRLITRKEFVAANAWSLNLSESDMNQLEIGANLNSTSACNSSAGSGLTYTNGQVPPSASADTLPGSLVSSVRSVRTGSTATVGCSSRYGVQDLSGNLSEWSLEEVNCTSNQHCNTATPSSFAFSSTTYNFDGVTGPMLDADLDDIEDATGIFNNWLFDSGNNDTTRMYLPMGLPADNEVITGVDMIPDFVLGASLSVPAIHGDGIRMNADQIFLSGVNGAMVNGGHFSSGSEAGRYAIEFKAKNSSDIRTGFRCIKTAP
ncbi:MAG: tandem-95 repeat protein [Bacteriovoracaceae bacterium]